MADLRHHPVPHAQEHALATERSGFGSHNDIFLDTMEEPPPGTTLPEPARVVDRRISTADAATVAAERVKDDAAAKPFLASPVAPVARDDEEPVDAAGWRARVAKLERHIKSLDADRADLTVHYQPRMGVTLADRGPDHVPLASLVSEVQHVRPATTTSTSVSLASSPDRAATASPDRLSPLAGMRHAAHGRSLSLSAAVGLRGSAPLLASDLSTSETDLGATTQTPSTTDLPARAGCTACRALALRLDQAADRTSQLTSQLARAVADVEAERALRARADQARDILDADLEDLTASLFAQANAMVESEARRRDEVERALRSETGAGSED
ncbi:hypothetical protein AMAG_16413 [Allomyces macrogynus ATCC 38327]|uniref:GDP/GTP exchange factor Sec2 N-terminal domain-containing protein n=1 Tax=Allomyces macrogynus (strain ATCC 38327) TaxID=578462 RepID=A0A0L0TD37_ALLM3|nr:hypothetical protein AMAG_16413 [Allomyces macrogynus ATCC 38327]|eukprot:KNE72652.1 hypothetical protein AMAG_16413 [Allomyces macrogynus ATCC 38327]